MNGAANSLIEKVKKAIQDARDDPAQPDHWEAHDAIQVVLREMKKYPVLDLDVEQHLWEMEIDNFAEENNIDLTEPKP